MPPVPLMVGSQNFSPALNVELTSATFAGVGSAIATAATSSIIGYDDHMLGSCPSSGERLSYQPFLAFHQPCCICATPCSASCWKFAWLATSVACDGSGMVMLVSDERE